MSEKRFILDSDFVKVTSQVVWDNQEEKGLTLMKLVDLLNEQQATIEMYQRRVNKREKQIDIMKFHILNFCTDEQIQSIKDDLEIASKLRRFKK